MLAQHQLWSEGTSSEDLEESRQDCTGGATPIQPLQEEIITAVHGILLPVIAKADKLIGNFTSNLAEQWMAVRTKFDGGKVVNRCQSSSWTTRCSGAALRRNLGMEWSPIAWQRITGSRASPPFWRHYKTRGRKLAWCKKSKLKPDVRQRARKRKASKASESVTKKARQAYGPECTTVTPEPPQDVLDRAMAGFLKEKVEISPQQQQMVEAQTRAQSDCGLWKEERRVRLTASNLSAVVKRNPKLPTCKLVSRLLYSGFRGNLYTAHGLAEERVTAVDYVAFKKDHGDAGIKILPCGFKIHPTTRWLGATPDGLVSVAGKVQGLLEMKNVLHRKQKTLREAATAKLPGFCLQVSDGVLQLKTSHPYYCQLQCQMEVWDLPWVDFVVRSTNPYQLHVERVPRDRELWAQWLPKLEAFYMKALLPELALPRTNQVPGIREPGIWVCVAIDSQAAIM